MSRLVRGCVACLLAVLASAAASARGKPPSFIVILIDTLRADHLGAYGFPGEISPHLDRLAEESVLFERCYAQAPWTPPSIGSLFTSLHPETHGLNVFRKQHFANPKTGKLRVGVLSERAVTLAELLRDAGYETVAFVTNPWLERPLGLGQGFERYDDRETGRGVTADALAGPFREWLESRDDDRPFFAYLHLMDVHDPWDASKLDFDALRQSAVGGMTRLAESELPPFEIEVRPAWADEKMRTELGYWTTRYASGVRACDRRLAPYLAFLHETGTLKHTYLIVTSDHGEELFDNGGWGHGLSLHEHQLRVPLLVRRPGGKDGGRRVPAMVGLIDLMPTVLSLARAPVPAALHGRDVSGLLRGRRVERPALFYASGTMWDPEVYSVRTERHRLIVDRATGRTELYDLETDPHETTDLSARGTELLATMTELLDAHLGAGSDGKVEAETREIESETLEKLEALGYVD